MSQTLQLRRAGTAELMARVLAEGELQIDKDLDRIHLGDGVTPGGIKFIPESELAAYGSFLWTDQINLSIPGALTNADLLRKLAHFTVDGNYVMPAIAGMAVGVPMIVQAQTAAVTLEAAAGSLFRDHNATLASLALNQYETVTLAKSAANRIMVVDRY